MVTIVVATAVVAAVCTPVDAKGLHVLAVFTELLDVELVRHIKGVVTSLRIIVHPEVRVVMQEETHDVFAVLPVGVRVEDVLMPEEVDRGVRDMPCRIRVLDDDRQVPPIPLLGFECLLFRPTTTLRFGLHELPPDVREIEEGKTRKTLFNANRGIENLHFELLNKEHTFSPRETFPCKLNLCLD